MKKRFILIAISLVMILLSSCSKSAPSTPPIPTKAEKTIIFYAVADNNLSAPILGNIKEAANANVDYTKNNVVVFIDHNTPDAPLSKKPQIIRLLGKDQFVVVKEYPEQNSCRIGFFKEVISEITKSFPAQSYGVILSAHGSGWHYEVESKSFGGDEIGENDSDLKEKNTLNISSIADGLPSCEFVLFDACTMSTIEVAYELKDKTKNFIGSAFLSPGEGIDYTKAIPKLIAGDYVGTAKDYYEKFYRKETISATVIKTENLAQIASTQKALFTQWGVSSAELVNLALNSPQELGAYLNDNQFDYINSLEKLAATDPKRDAKALISLIKAQVLYTASTPKRSFANLSGDFIDVETPICCGISMLLPFATTTPDDLAYYKTLKWYSQSGVDLFSK